MNLSYTLPKAEENILSGVKIHTLREDRLKRWEAGKTIHHCYSFRSANGYKCFLKNECVSVQQVLLVLLYLSRHKEKVNYALQIRIDRKELSPAEQNELVLNDGFASLEDFIQWFFPEKKSNGEYKKTLWAGRMIHWTNLKY